MVVVDHPTNRVESWATTVSTYSDQEKLQFLESLSEKELRGLEYGWWFWGRPAQFAPSGDWLTWLILTGRGWGKTRSGAEWIKQKVEQGARRTFCVGRTASDVRDTMVKGESGILSICSPSERPKYSPSKRLLEWPNGAETMLFSAKEPSLLRGPQCEYLWADELAWWQYADEAWDNAMFGLRLGRHPQAMVTTTPRPTKIIKKLVKAEDTVVVTGSTYDNVENLAGSFYNQVITKYKGTRLGRQEIYGDILDDNPRALWKRNWIDISRINKITAEEPLPDLVRVVVAIDPPKKSSEEEGGAECGITVAGKDRSEHGYVLADLSHYGTPAEWGATAVRAFHAYHADRIVGETNNGGDMVEHTIRTIEGGKYIPFKNVTASRGKELRGEPISSLYQRGFIHHIGTFPELEDQQCEWEPGMDSPDRLDAVVWALTDLEFAQIAELLVAY